MRKWRRKRSIGAKALPCRTVSWRVLAQAVCRTGMELVCLRVVVRCNELHGIDQDRAVRSRDTLFGFGRCLHRWSIAARALDPKPT
jgi:hypothetical protein